MYFPWLPRAQPPQLWLHTHIAHRRSPRESRILRCLGFLNFLIFHDFTTCEEIVISTYHTTDDSPRSRQQAQPASQQHRGPPRGQPHHPAGRELSRPPPTALKKSTPSGPRKPFAQNSRPCMRRHLRQNSPPGHKMEPPWRVFQLAGRPPFHLRIPKSDIFVLLSREENNWRET